QETSVRALPTILKILLRASDGGLELLIRRARFQKLNPSDQAEWVDSSAKQKLINAVDQVDAVFKTGGDDQCHLKSGRALIKGGSVSSQAALVHRAMEQVEVNLGHESGIGRGRAGYHLAAAEGAGARGKVTVATIKGCNRVRADRQRADAEGGRSHPI